MTHRKFATIAATLCAALFGSGCTAAFLDTARHGIFVQEDTNFSEKNYAAADYLIQQAKGYVSKYAHIQALPLSDVNQPNMSSTFGKMVPEQIGVRLSQLGYQIDLEKVAISPDINYLRPADTSRKANFILSGTFMRARTDMNVSVRMIDTRNNQIVGVFDYTLPLTREINDLARPEPKIIRMTR